MKRTIFLKMVLLLIISGCAHHYKAELRPVAPEFLPRLTFENPVDISGEYIGGEKEIKMYGELGQKYYADRKDLTDTAVKVAEDILKQNHIPIKKDATKSIVLSILDSKGEKGWGTRINVILRVRAGDVITREFKGSQKIGNLLQLSWAIGAAITDAVIKMFNDNEIKNYLSE